MLNPLVRRLQSFTRLSGADRAALDRLVRRSRRDVPARRDLSREGEAPQAMSVVLDGWACRYKTLEDGRRQVLGFLLPGDFCDLRVFLLRATDHSIGAVTRLVVAEVSRREYEALAAEHPRVGRALEWHELASAATAREWVLNLGQRTALERIAHLLCELRARLEALGLTRGATCDLPLTQTDLAEATGLTPVHVNRRVQELRRRGLIELGERVLTVPDAAALRAVAGFNPNYLHLEREGRRFDAED